MTNEEKMAQRIVKTLKNIRIFDTTTQQEAREFIAQAIFKELYKPVNWPGHCKCKPNYIECGRHRLTNGMLDACIEAYEESQG